MVFERIPAPSISNPVRATKASCIYNLKFLVATFKKVKRNR